MATHSSKTVKLDIYTSDVGELESVVFKLNSKEAACTLYRSITEHHAFYRCDSVRPAVKEQVARDFFDTLLSWLHDSNNTEHNYIFDTERTCREAYDHARRILYNFGASTAAAMATSVDGEQKSKSRDSCDTEHLHRKVQDLTEKIYFWRESFNCPVCRDKVVDNVLQCGHLMCSICSELCQLCPLCRTTITSKTKFYLPIDVGCDQNKELKCHATKSAINNHTYGGMDVDVNNANSQCILLVE